MINFLRIKFIIISSLLISSFVSAQNCFPNGIELKTQEEIDNFAFDYPDCTIIEGDLEIGDRMINNADDNIINLDGLTQIVEIHGSLEVHKNDVLTSVEGLSSLRILKGDLNFSFNSELSSLKGLDSLTRIGGTLEAFANCTSCFRLEGLEQLEVIGGSLYLRHGSFHNNGLSFLESIDTIHGNITISRTNLGSLEGISTLRFLGGGVSISDDGLTLEGLENLTEIYGNLTLYDASTSFRGLENVKRIHGDIRLNESSSGFSGLKNVEQIDGDIYLNFVGSTNISGLTSLQRLGGSFTYYNTNVPETFTGCNNLTYIGGDFNLNDNNALQEVLGFTSLDTIMGNLSFVNHYSMNGFQGLDAISYVGGNVVLSRNFKMTTFSFPHIEKINGKIIVANNDDLESLVFSPAMAYLGGLEMKYSEKVEEISLPQSLTYLGGVDLSGNDVLTSFVSSSSNTILDGDFIVWINGKLEELVGFENVEEIKGDFVFYSNNMITEFNGFANCNKVGGDFEFYAGNNLNRFNGFQPLDSIGGEFSLDVNHIDSISGFGQLTYVGSGVELSGINGMNNLSLLNNLDSIRGNLRLSWLNDFQSFGGIEHINTINGNLDIGGLQGIEDFQSFDFIKNINGSLSINNCDSLKNLSGLDSIKALKGYLSVINCQSIETLEGIHNLDPSTIDSGSNWTHDLSVYSNDSLKNCSLSFLCEFFDMNDKTFRIENNSDGCNSHLDIDCKDFGLSGNVYFDLNQNKQRDNDEFGISGVQIMIGSNDAIAVSDQNGDYIEIATENESYLITPDVLSKWNITTDNATYQRTFIPGHPDNVNNDFGLYPINEVVEVSTALSWNPTRCNEEVRFYMRYHNTGTQIASGKVQLEFDNQVDYISATGNPIRNGRKLTWNYSDLYPYDYNEVEIVFDMPSEQSTGELLFFEATAEVDSSGTLLQMDTLTYEPVVLCSYDPNDKLVLPIGKKDAHYIADDQELTYTIRFQNTGNAPAIDVRILDTLDQNLDHRTMEVINSSFPVNTSIYDDAVQFLFKDIWLVDSLSNESESHGFVTYKIMPQPGLDDFTKIENTAHIIFDYNPAIVTNTAFNTIYHNICDDVVIEVDTILCEGQSFMGYDFSGTFLDTVSINVTCDSVYNTTIYVLNRFDQIRNFEICRDSSVTFAGVTYSPEVTSTFIDTAYFSNGCIQSVFEINIDVYQPQTVVIDTSICEGDEFMGLTESGMYSVEGYNAEEECYDDFEITLDVYQPQITEIDTTICEGEDFMGFTESGTYLIDEFNPIVACYDKIEINLTVLPLNDPMCISSTSNITYSDIKIYPSPLKNQFSVLSERAIEEVTLLDMNSKKVKTWQTRDKSGVLQLQLAPNTAAGIYIIQINHGSFSVFRKVVIY